MAAQDTASRRIPAGVAYAVAASLLFGAGTPLAKLLVARINPVLLASLLYLGSGVGLGLWLSIRRWRGAVRSEAPLARGDLGWFGGAVLAGGVLGPLLLMLGLSRTPAASSSLLLNLEGVFTALLAWFAFGENFDRRVLLGMLAIIAGGVVISWGGVLGATGLWGPLAVAGACLAWGVDNNLTRKVSGGDPVQIAAVKGAVAGTVNLCIALAAGARLPPAGVVAAAGALGLAGYGISLTLFVLALRHLGTARTGAYFSTAPFLGAALSVPLLGEAVTPALVVSAAAMGLGVWLHLTETHDHEHRHAALVHDHRHTHDGSHHAHTHDGRPVETAHAHEHLHEPAVHTHRHFPDLHHAHPH